MIFVAMSELKNKEIWEVIRQGLPKTPSEGTDVLPVPEMLRVIEFCLDERVEDFDTAYRLAKRLFESNDRLEVLNWYASVCYDAKKYRASYEACLKIIDVMPSSGTYFNASRAAHRSGFPEEAEALVRKALTFGDSSVPMEMDLSVYMSAQGRFDEAFAILESIDEKKLSSRDRFALEANKGWHRIRSGDFRGGMKSLVQGRHIKVWGTHSAVLSKPLWDGVTREGETILIVGEGGIGDEMIAARFSKIIRERGMKVVMSSVHKAKSILARVSTIDRVLDGNELSGFSEYDRFVPAMDLPAVLGIEEREIPKKPYLSADPAFVEKWKTIIPESRKLRIGIRWSGNPLYEDDLQRTVPFEMLESLADIPDVELYSLQRDAGVEQIAGSRVTPLHDKLGTLEDALGAIANLDLVVTSCTSIAHLSAALGKPTWILLPFMPYYMWAKPGKKTAWYESVTLYRKSSWRSWDGTATLLRKDLQSLSLRAKRGNLRRV